MSRISKVYDWIINPFLIKKQITEDISLNDLNQSDSGQPQDENADGGSDSKEIS